MTLHATIRACLSILMMAGLAVAQTKAKPLSEADVVDLLRNFVPATRVAELVRNKGIDFVLKPQMEQELRQAGATDPLINLLREKAPQGARESVPRTLTAGSVKINPKDGQRYAWIPPGSFTMGCSTGDNECLPNEKPAHPVTITKGFWIGQTAVTTGAWKRYRIATGTAALPTEDNVGRKNWNEAGEENMPAVMMTWNEAKSYCEWASLRLPTEAEWEYAARAGSTSARYGDLDAIAWYVGNSGTNRIESFALSRQSLGDYAKTLKGNGNFVHPVALKQPNAWKLYDMLGNVSGWTADWYEAQYYGKNELVDPLGPPGGQARVVRGGSWNDGSEYVRLSLRVVVGPGVRGYNAGDRCDGELP